MPKKGKKDAALKAAKKEKQQKKFAKKKMKENINDDEEDIDDIVARLPSSSLSVDSKSAIIVSCNTQPSARAHCSFTLLPSGEFFLFGGEIFDGQKTQVYNEVYRWNVERSDWRRVESPVMPKPRCSHQAIIYKDGVYIFGGEFSTSEQFYHYRDLWRFDLKSNLWEEIKGTGTPPSARSGHRVVVWRNMMVLFGGFYDTLKETHYLNDLYLFSFADQKWTKVVYKPQQQVPPCRSGCVLAVHPSGEYIFMTGGYAKVKDTGRSAVGMYYDDSWLLNMRGLMKGSTTTTTSSAAMPVWEKLKKKGKWPSVRSGSAMIVHKNLALLFGGVHDDDEGGMTLRSIFYNDLYAFDMDRKRWYAYSLRSVRTGGGGKSRKTKEIGGKGGGEAKRGIKREDDEEERKNNSDDDNDDDFEDLDYQENTFGYIDQDGKLVRIRVDEEEKEGDELMPHLPYEEKEEEEQSEGKEEREVEMMSSSSSLNNEKPTEIMNNSTTSTASLTSDSNSSSRDSSSSNNKVDGISSSDSSSTKMNGHDCSSNTKMNSNSSTTIGGDSCIMNLTSNRSDTNIRTSTANSNNMSGNNNRSGVITNLSPSSCPSLSDGGLALPLPRINAGLCIRGNQLYVYGGLVEIGNKELTLDDCWSLNLNTRQHWVCLLKGRMEHQIWKEDEDEEEGAEEDEEEDEEEGSDEYSLSSEEEEGGESSSESEEEIVEDNVDRNKRKRNTAEDKERETASPSSLASAAAVGMTSAVSAASAAASGGHSVSSSSSIASLLGSMMTTNAEGYQELSSVKTKANIVKASGAKFGGGEKVEFSVKLRDEMKYLRDLLGLENEEQTPQVGEALRDFFDRTKLFWMKKVEEENHKVSMEFNGEERKMEEEERKMEEQTVEEKEEERDEKKTKEKEKKKDRSGRQVEGRGKKSSNSNVNRIDLKESKRIAFTFAEKRYEVFVPHLERLKELEELQRQAEEGQQKEENVLPNKKKGKVKNERVDGKGSSNH